MDHTAKVRLAEMKRAAEIENSELFGQLQVVPFVQCFPPIDVVTTDLVWICHDAGIWFLRFRLSFFPVFVPFCSDVSLDLSWIFFNNKLLLVTMLC